VHGAHYRASHRQISRQSGGRRPSWYRVIEPDIGGVDLRETEIENLQLSARRDDDVDSLDVAVDDPLGVRGLEGIRNLNALLD
jgi:hypothetical protein